MEGCVPTKKKKRRGRIKKSVQGLAKARKMTAVQKTQWAMEMNETRIMPQKGRLQTKGEGGEGVFYLR